MKDKKRKTRNREDKTGNKLKNRIFMKSWSRQLHKWWIVFNKNKKITKKE